jgi:hypothetical protein
MGAVDALTGTYRLPCPTRGTSRVCLSAFREIDRVAGVAHPAVFRVVFLCACGEEHTALVAHDTLDWAPLGLGDDATFLNLMTSRHDDVASELTALASAHIRRGEWPWSFFCCSENAPRPATPSAFRHVACVPGTVAFAVRCPTCDTTSINLATPPHLDVPFHSDAHVGVVAHAFEDDALPSAEAFRDELGRATFDERRLVFP